MVYCGKNKGVPSPLSKGVPGLLWYKGVPGPLSYKGVPGPLWYKGVPEPLWYKGVPGTLWYKEVLGPCGTRGYLALVVQGGTWPFVCDKDLPRHLFLFIIYFLASKKLHPISLSLSLTLS